MNTVAPRHSVSVAGVVLDNDRALLVQRRDNQRWEPPGGVLELDESIVDGVRREVHEETGLDVEPVALTGVYKNMTHGIVALVFRCRKIGGELTTTDETSGFRWATSQEVKELVSEAFAVRVFDAMADDAAPAVRHHDGAHLL